MAASARATTASSRIRPTRPHGRHPVASAGMGTSTVSEVIERVDRWWAAVIAGDTAAVDALSTDELRYVHSSGHVDTKATYLPAIVDGTFDYRASTRSEEEGWLVGGAVLLTGQAVTDVVVRGRPVQLDVRYTTVWVQDGASWRMLAWQSTPVRR